MLPCPLHHAHLPTRTGYDSSTLDATFRVGVMGLTEAGLRRAEADIDAALRRAAEEGFDQDRVAAALHQV